MRCTSTAPPAAIVAALVFFNLAVVVRTVGALWEALDPRREEAAAALGASPWQVLRTVTLPALAPAIVSAASVVFLFCATSFGVVLTLGGLRYATVETEIYLLTTQYLDLRAAAALSVLQLLVVSVLLYVAAADRGRPRSSRSTGRPSATPPAGRDGTTYRCWGWRVLALASSAAAADAAAAARCATRRLGARPLPRAHTTGGDALLVPVSEALGNSLRVAVDATLLAMLLGVLVSLVVAGQARSRVGRRARHARRGCSCCRSASPRSPSASAS